MVRKHVIIVGGSSGIGREIACKYVEMGWKVGITGRSRELLDSFCQHYAGSAVSSCFDVSSETAEEQLKLLSEELGGFDLFIYNAGIGLTSMELDPGNEMRTIMTNVKGFTVAVCWAFLYFQSKGSGQIAVISSVAATRGNSWTPAYSASKSFISRYAEGLAMKAWRLKLNIQVTDIRPGFLDTKTSNTNRRFWITSPSEAARQIIQGIDKRKRIVYVGRRWWIVARLMHWLPFSVLKRIM